MNKLTKIIQRAAKKHNKRAYTIYESLIDMLFQIKLLDCCSKRYKFLDRELTDFITEFRRQVDEKPFTDILGEVMHEIGCLDKSKLGQCMTPNDISSLCASLMNRYGNEKKELNLSDICVGSGSMILAKMKRFNEMNLELANIIINDIDENMVKTSLVQIWLNAKYCNYRFFITATRSNALTQYVKGGDLIYKEDKDGQLYSDDETVHAIQEEKERQRFFALFNKTMRHIEEPHSKNRKQVA